MRIQTGRGTIPLITLVGIWSISALNALPGLAAVDSGERLNGNRIWLDRTLIDRFDISFLYREIPDEAIWFKFCYYECNVGISHDLNGISGGGELAFTVCRLSIALDFHRTFRILEKEYGK